MQGAKRDRNSAMAWVIGAMAAVIHDQVVAFMPLSLPSS